MPTVFATYVSRCIVYYHFCQWLMARLQPSFSNGEVTGTGTPSNGSSLRRRAKQVREVPVRMMTLIHACFTSICGYAYLFGLLSESGLLEARTVSTSYLVFDMFHNWKMWHRQGFETVSAAPAGVVFHHLSTICFMHGLLLGDAPHLVGILVYFWSELPVIFLNVTWLYFHIGKSNTRECAVCANITILGYFICRILLFPVVFLFVLLPQQSLTSLGTYLFIAVFALVYLLNVIWFSRLLQKNAQFLPPFLQSAVSALANMPQYHYAPLLIPPPRPPTATAVRQR